MGQDWVIGVIINVIGSISINMGTNLLKYSHTHPKLRQATGSKDYAAAQNLHPDELPELTEEEKKYSKKIWVFGLSIFVAGSIFNFISFGYAAQSLLAALGSVQFVSNVVFGRFILKEIVTHRILAATALIVAGNTLTVYFSSHSSQEYTADDLWEFYDSTYKGFIFGECCLMLALYTSYKHIRKLEKGGVEVAHAKTIKPLLYATTSALVGTQSVLQAKCLSSLLRQTLVDGENQFVYAFTYSIIIAWALSMIFWMTRMNRALAKFDGLFIIPVLQVNWTFFSIIGGGVYFKEFDTFSGEQVAGFVSGLVIVFLGVYLLSPQPKKGRLLSVAGPDVGGRSLSVCSVRSTGSGAGGAIGRRERSVSYGMLMPVVTAASQWGGGLGDEVIDEENRDDSQDGVDDGPENSAL